MKTRIQKGFTLIELLVVITIIAILAGLALPAFTKIQEKGYITKGVNNCKQVITYLKIYSTDNNDQYPDADASAPANANDAFRILFKNGIADNETIFGCPGSIYGVPDGNIGTAPDYTEAVKTKENHWMLTKGITSSSGGYPLVYEVATTATWDPTWDASAVGKTSKGRTWSGGKVIVGLNDSSVSVLPCASSTGTQKLKNQGSGTTNVFSQFSSSGTPPTVLDVN